MARPPTVHILTVWIMFHQTPIRVGAAHGGPSIYFILSFYGIPASSYPDGPDRIPVSPDRCRLSTELRTSLPPLFRTCVWIIVGERLAGFMRRPVRLRFSLRQASLCSCWFDERPEIPGRLRPAPPVPDCDAPGR